MTMKLKNITARAHPSGKRIDLTWQYPESPEYPGVRVMRKYSSYPINEDDGVVVAEGIGLTSALDQNLRGESIYYYSLFPYKDNGSVKYVISPYNRISAMATDSYNMAGQLYDMLPRIYHRYDKNLPKEIPKDMAEEDKHRGLLRRFMELPGTQLDQLYSFIRAMHNIHNINTLDGSLLPLFAHWIGWQIDFQQEVIEQRLAVKNAPAIYQRVGIIPTVEAAFKRITGWESRTKEFVHNVFLSNQPDKLNIWLKERTDGSEIWSESKEPLSLDLAFEGRPEVVQDGDGTTLWLFYHTLKKEKWDIWYKTYKSESGWSPSQSFTNRSDIDKHPCAARIGDKLWVFWNTYNVQNKKWSINYRILESGQWSDIKLFKDDQETERKSPQAVVDINGYMWLFWLEKTEKQWQVKYNKHSGTDWILDVDVLFPPDSSGNQPRVEQDIFVLSHSNQSLWVFWSQKQPTGESNKSLWKIAYRTKPTLDENIVNWNDIQSFPSNQDVQDREPAAHILGNGNLELFWSSNQEGSWSIWRSVFDISQNLWQEVPEEITNNPYCQHNPLPFKKEQSTLLFYRSNEILYYSSQYYKATETVDFRYTGSFTVDTRNFTSLKLHGTFDDFQTYTYDTGFQGDGKTHENWYARHKIGLYVTANMKNPENLDINQTAIEKRLNKFLPVQVRTVFIPDELLLTETNAKDTNPAAIEDNKGNIWVFWVSEKNGSKAVVYNFYNQENKRWQGHTQLVQNTSTNSNPSALRDNKGYIWVFWEIKVPVDDLVINETIAIRIRRYNLNTEQWEPEQTLIESTSAFSFSPSAIEENDGDVKVFWESLSLINAGIIDIWYKRFKYIDSNWVEMDTHQLTQNAGKNIAPFPLIDKNGITRLFWLSDRDNHFKIYHTHYNQSKEEWADDELLITDDLLQSDFFPLIDSKGNIWVFYISLQPGNANIADIYYKRYKNGSWEKEIRLTYRNIKAQRLFALQDNDNNIWVFWESIKSYGSGSQSIWFKRYSQGIWNHEIQLSSDMGNNGKVSPIIDMHGQLWIFWGAKRNENQDIWYQIISSPK